VRCLRLRNIVQVVTHNASAPTAAITIHTVAPDESPVGSDAAGLVDGAGAAVLEGVLPGALDDVLDDVGVTAPSP